MARVEPCRECRSSAKVAVNISIDWGDDRGVWDGLKTFCSLRCLAEWAAERADEHEAV